MRPAARFISLPTQALAERLRDAQTVALVLALRAVKVRRDHALQVETTARVIAERDALAKRCEWFRAAHMLVAQEYVFLAPKPQGGPFVYNCASLAVFDGEPALWVSCGDTFAWACADAEHAEYADAPELLRIGVEEGWPGLTRWVQARRVAREEPAECIPPVQEMIATSDSLRAERDAARAELARTEREARTALDALHARVDAAERAAETARAEEREACVTALPPTLKEVAAHALAHPCGIEGHGLWMVRGPDVLPVVVPMRAGDGCVEARVLDETLRYAIRAAPDEGDAVPGFAWRPLTAEGDPAPWPEVTP